LNPPPEIQYWSLEERCSGTGTTPHHPPPSSPAKVRTPSLQASSVRV
jgi:hypothetical protein